MPPKLTPAEQKVVEEFARELDEKVHYFAKVNQYPEESDEQKAYLEGVNTAKAMMYIDLTGTPKSNGMLTTLLLAHRAEKLKITAHFMGVLKYLKDNPNHIDFYANSNEDTITDAIVQGHVDHVKELVERARKEERSRKAAPDESGGGTYWFIQNGKRISSIYTDELSMYNDLWRFMSGYPTNQPLYQSELDQLTKQ